jgi:lysophospholipase L1-like esterase
VHVVADGLGGRTTAYDDILADCDRNGARLLPSILQSQGPADVVIIMLGTNDLKPTIHGKAIGARQGIKKLISLVKFHDWGRKYDAPKTLIVAPPPLCETSNRLYGALYAGQISESTMLADLYRELAAEAGCWFFDAGSVCTASPADGVHLTAQTTRTLGQALVPVVAQILESLQHLEQGAVA